MAKQNSEILEANGVRLNLETREISCDGIQVDVTPVEFDTLEILVRSAGQVIPAGELTRALDRRHANPFEGNLKLHVNRLKSKLERGRRLIRIVEGTGYLFMAADEHGASSYQLA